MRVARNVTVEDVVVEDVPDPVAGPGEVVCRVLACGVCGSDVSPSWVERKVPAVLGHEVVGQVVEVGPGGPRERLGEVVIVHHHAACGDCEACRQGLDTLCAQFAATRLDPGGFADRVRVQAELLDELLPVDGLDVDAAVFTEPLGCVMRALTADPPHGDERVLVVGAGTGGLLTIAALQALTEPQLFVREPRPERLALAEAYGARPHEGEPCDVVVVCAGGPGPLNDAIAACAPGGEVLLYATPPSGLADVDLDTLYRREARMRTSYSAGPWDMQEALRLLRSGAVDPRPLITHRLPLDQTAEALRLQRTGEAIKALVLP